jgi:NADH:ubiquinone oxidoreductase subunit
MATGYAMDFLLKFFTWWNGQTFGTQLFTWRKGVRVGEDEQGNVFYQTRDGSRRWVIYNGEAEASRVSPEWHGWLHHTYQEPPTIAPLPRKPWEKPGIPNLTGTTLAYRPPGSLLVGRQASPDYEAWAPE